MYEPRAHALLNSLLEGVEVERPLLTRLAANFHRIHQLFGRLYGHREGLEVHLGRLVEVMLRRAEARAPDLQALDRRREADPRWYLSQRWVGMALYADRFAGDLPGFADKLPYLEELGVNVVHLMPLQACPKGASDGGYAVSDFKAVDPRLGTLEDLREAAARMREKGMLLTLDIVVNHTSNEHAWAEAARRGERPYSDYYYAYPDRGLPDQFEASMPEIFPETAPGSFTWDEEMGRWVMTVFNHYQWDLNYTNPAVFIEMLDVILFWANEGADVLRLDAPAFLWKRIGTACQNLPEAHTILQLFRACAHVAAPGLLFIAEAIVAPNEIIRYFGQGPRVEPECEIAYHATLMALLWDAVATRNVKVTRRALAQLPSNPEGTTWLTYARCHDDIGLGFDDADIAAAGYDPPTHRRFLLDYFTGGFPGSQARGALFGYNAANGDGRIAGTLASLAGLEAGLEARDEAVIDRAIERILLLHAVILSFGGIPMLFYGDEVGALNDMSFEQEPDKADDSRWMHRPRLDWARIEWRKLPNSVERRVFSALQRLIRARKATPAFADDGARVLHDVSNPHLLVYSRAGARGGEVMVVANFDEEPQLLEIPASSELRFGPLVDLARRAHLTRMQGRLLIPALGFYWLSRTTPTRASSG